jgi:uncharacterized integral membrane protein (TIGR00697 family)
VPLTLYLLTFVIVFARRPVLKHDWMVALQPFVLIPLAIVMAFGGTTKLQFVIPLHLAAFFVTALVVANIIAVKLVEIGGRVFPAGLVIFPLSYLLGDVLAEVYGVRAARHVIWLGFACNLVVVGAIQAAIHLPPAEFWADNQAAYEQVLGTTWRLFLASLAAYVVGELANAYVLGLMKAATGGRFLWTRTIGSTIVGEGLDSLIFVSIAFAGTGAALVNPIVTTWLIKVAWETAATPATYAIVNYLKRADGVDVYDFGPPAAARA